MRGYAQLSGADLSSANLTGVFLGNANLSGANLSFAQLSEAKALTQDQVNQACTDDKTRFLRGLRRRSPANGKTEKSWSAKTAIPSA